MSKFLFLFIVLIFITILGLRFYFFYQNKPKLYDGEVIKFETTLFSEPKITSRVQKFSVNYHSDRIFVTTNLFPQSHYGDTLEVAGKIRYLTSNQNNRLITINFPKIEAKYQNKNPILSLTSFVRQKIIKFFDSNLAPNYSGLLLGIVFGIKEEIPTDFLKILQNVGVMHIIAASGMNVTMTAGFISSILILFLRRQVALIISIVVILFYAVLAGFQASIIRASIMGILVFTAQILGRQAWPGFILFLTGYSMLIWDPSLLFDIGFQLSFLSTMGLLFIPSRISPSNSFFPVLESLQTTIFAQVSTLPVIIANFGFYSIWSVVVNGLVLWTIPLLMVIGGVGAIVSFIFEPIARFIILLSLPLLIYFEMVAKLFSGFGNLVKIEELSWAAIAGYYFLVISIVLLVQKDKNPRL